MYCIEREQLNVLKRSPNRLILIAASPMSPSLVSLSVAFTFDNVPLVSQTRYSRWGQFTGLMAPAMRQPWVISAWPCSHHHPWLRFAEEPNKKWLLEAFLIWTISIILFFSFLTMWTWIVLIAQPKISPLKCSDTPYKQIEKFGKRTHRHTQSHLN